MSAALLEVQDLVTELRTESGPLLAVDRVSFSLAAHKTLGLVGESGCGKSMTALSILRLVPDPPGHIIAGRVLFNGEDLLALEESRMRELRGNQIAMVFQEPLTALNPVLTVGEQVAEAVRLHQRASRASANEKTEALFQRVGIASPRARLRAYPHQLSGGMRQRVVLAMALACEPLLLIADEPTTALDVTLQAQILEVLCEEQRRLGMGVLLITHDLGLVAELCEHVVVLYAGQVVESAPAAEFFTTPKHPYSAGLIRAARSREERSDKALDEIPGYVPDLRRMVGGCRFVDRCSRAKGDCRVAEPPLIATASREGEPRPGAIVRQVRCIHPLDDKKEAE